jgi:signal transduction histidine kinase
MLRRFLQSMTGRFFLILLGGTIVSGSLAIALAAWEAREMLNELRNRHLTERIEQIILTLDAAPVATRPKIAEIASRGGVRIELMPDTIPEQARHPSDEAWATTLAGMLGPDREVAVLQRFSSDCPVRSRGRITIDDDTPNKCRTLLTSLSDGTTLRMDLATPPDRLPLPFQPGFLPYLVLFLFCVAALTFLVARLATTHIRTLAQAAHELGRNLEQPRLRDDKGPSEVREAVSAFNSMQTQIRHFIKERTYMLAAIAHDLQTPLTRLRLRLEKVEDEELRDKLIHDLALTQTIVKEGLDLARSVDAEEPFELLDLDSLITSICDDATDAGLKVTQSGRIGVPVKVRPNALRRCLGNLVDNAVKYGGFARINVRKHGPRVVISVVDGGPGIPDEQLETVLKPFQRLETSRSRDSGGTGLGLTIAANIAERHRGRLYLRNIRKDGQGLEAVVELYIA